MVNGTFPRPVNQENIAGSLLRGRIFLPCPKADDFHQPIDLT
jgi:hypothetical protein